MSENAKKMPRAHHGTVKRGSIPAARNMTRSTKATRETAVLQPARRIPAQDAIQLMATLDSLGGEMTEKELRILSETRPRTGPWQNPDKD